MFAGCELNFFRGNKMNTCLRNILLRPVTGTKMLINFSLLVLVSLTFAGIASAQAVSGVTGVVSDTTGAVVPGVNVTLTDTKTSRELTTKKQTIRAADTFQNVSARTSL